MVSRFSNPISNPLNIARCVNPVSDLFVDLYRHFCCCHFFHSLVSCVVKMTLWLLVIQWGRRIVGFPVHERRKWFHYASALIIVHSKITRKTTSNQHFILLYIWKTRHPWSHSFSHLDIIFREKKAECFFSSETKRKCGEWMEITKVEMGLSSAVRGRQIMYSIDFGNYFQEKSVDLKPKVGL